MAEYRLYPEGSTPTVSTAEFHRDRERAPHLEQPVHRPRLDKAAEFVRLAAAQHQGRCSVPEMCGPFPVSDLGCGDGGLLQLLAPDEGIQAWGYDFQPSNKAGWAERGVTARSLDVFGTDQARVRFGHATVTTEVLEHLARPHEAVQWIGQNSSWIIASSPWTETAESHDACHAWAWDMGGYRALIQQGGFEVLRHEILGQFQVILGVRQ